ncbi:13643_t:CDS:2, partial [Racocetra persica]
PNKYNVTRSEDKDEYEEEVLVAQTYFFCKCWFVKEEKKPDKEMVYQAQKEKNKEGLNFGSMTEIQEEQSREIL